VRRLRARGVGGAGEGAGWAAVETQLRGVEARGPTAPGRRWDVPLVRFLAGVAEWVVYEALGGLSPACAEAYDGGTTDPLD
jgi:hypothetical protein